MTISSHFYIQTVIYVLSLRRGSCSCLTQTCKTWCGTKLVLIQHCYHRILLQGEDQLLQLLEVRSTQSSNRVPSNGSVPVGIGNSQATRDSLSALGVDTSASVRGTGDDIVQSLESL